mgnify:CR=1 FL=1
MKLTIKHYIVLGLFFATMLTSLWPNNIYLLFSFSLSSLFLLRLKVDRVSISLLLFSCFYCINQCLTIGFGSGFVFVSTLLAPFSFYNFGCWLMGWIKDDRQRLNFLFLTFLCYLLPALALAIQDMMIVGLINESRHLLLDIGKEDTTLAATLYGLMSSTGIGFVAILFSSKMKIWKKLLLFFICIIAVLIVIHLVNRTGLVLLALCILFSFAYSTRLNMSRIIITSFLLLIIFFIIVYSGLISQDVIDAYVMREDSASSNASEFGGRMVLWEDALSNIFTHPFGWKRLNYAHNLWIDLAAVGGWISLFFFMKATFASIKGFFKVMYQHVTPFKLILLTMYLSMMFNSMVEPVIEGSLLFFVLFIFIWGIIISISKKVE